MPSVIEEILASWCGSLPFPLIRLWQKFKHSRLADGSETKAFEPFNNEEYLTEMEAYQEDLCDRARAGRFKPCADMGHQTCGSNPTRGIRRKTIRKSVEKMLPVPGTDDVYLLLYGERMVKWDGGSVLPIYLPSSFKRVSVDGTLLDDAEDKWPAGDQPTTRQVAALNAAMPRLRISV